MNVFKTPHNSTRVIINRSELPKPQSKLEQFMNAMSAFSIWGNIDYNKDDKIGWEMPVNIDQEIVEMVLNKFK